MIFGNPYRFAIWVEHVPQWGDAHKNGMFYFIVNGNLYPGDIRTSTLSTDLYEIIDSDCALISHPQNDEIFSLSTEDAFRRLFALAYPESSEEDEYPEQLFDYCITPQNISSFGGCFFAVANSTSLRIIGGNTEHLVEDEHGEKNIWEHIDDISLEDLILSKDEICEIMIKVRAYADLLLS